MQVLAFMQQLIIRFVVRVVIAVLRFTGWSVQQTFLTATGILSHPFSPRAKRSWLYLAIHLGVAWLACWLDTGADGSPVTGLALAWLLWGHVLSLWLTERLYPYLVPTLYCRYCAFEFDAVDRWSLHQDYTDDRERHILSVREPYERTMIGFTHCPNCGSTILLR